MDKFIFKNVSVEVKDTEGKKRSLLNNITMNIPKGKIVTVVGPSGAGKSTLLSLFNRLQDPTEGEILLDGRNIKQEEVLLLRRKVGLVMQQSYLFPGTISDNIVYGPALQRRDKVVDVKKHLNQVNLSSDYAVRDVSNLSGGEQQRVALARVLANNPEVILLDEPTSALDPSSSKAIEVLMRDLAVEGITVVWVTHNLRQAHENGDLTALIVDGKLIEYRETKGFFQDPISQVTKEFIWEDKE